MSRTSISPFQHGNSWWARFPAKHGNGRQRTLGTSDEVTAVNLCAMLVSLRVQARWYLLDRLSAGTASLAAAYKAWAGPGIEDYEIALRTGSVSIDLEPFVAKFEAQITKDKVLAPATRDIYVRHVRQLVPADTRDKKTGVVTHHPFPSSAFTADRVKEFLMELDASRTNRHRASLSAFCKYLMEHPATKPYVAHNVALEVKAQKQVRGRIKWLAHPAARKLIAAVEDDQARAWCALSIATGMERIAITSLRHQDVDLAKFSAHAHGTKREHRDRTCTAPRIFDWAWKIFAGWYKSGPSGAKVFTIKPDLAYRRLKEACAKAGVEDFTMHDWRHCFAVLCLQAKDPIIEPVAIAQQLGHKNMDMLWNVYGQYRGTAAAMRPTPAVAAPAKPKAKKPKSAAKAKRPKQKP